MFNRLVFVFFPAIADCEEAAVINAEELLRKVDD